MLETVNQRGKMVEYCYERAFKGLVEVTKECSAHKRGRMWEMDPIAAGISQLGRLPPRVADSAGQEEILQIGKTLDE